MIPSPWVAVILTLGTFRLWRIIAADTLPVLVKLRMWLLGGVFYTDGEFHCSRPLLAEWLECPYCSGAWCSAVAYLLWLWTPDVLYVATPLAISAVVGIVRTRLD